MPKVDHLRSGEMSVYIQVVLTLIIGGCIIALIYRTNVRFLNIIYSKETLFISKSFLDVGI